MATVTATELVTFAKSKLGTPYVYGLKGEILTQAKINSLASLYPSVYDATYVNKAKKYIGKRCTDCSGLISWKTGILRGSSDYKNSATVSYPITKLDETMVGWGLWRSGHIGVYIGGGYCIEARGIDYGTVQTKVKDRTFTHVIKLKDIDYGSKTVVGWKKEDGKWHFYENGTKAKSKWIQSEAGYWYYFDENGNLYTGWVLGADGVTWYYCDESTNDDLIGKMVTGRVITTGGKNYYMQDSGKMLPAGYSITFNVTESGALEMVRVAKN